MNKDLVTLTLISPSTYCRIREPLPSVNGLDSVTAQTGGSAVRRSVFIEPLCTSLTCTVKDTS